MALFKAQDTMKWLEMNLSLIIPNLTFTDTLDSFNYPIALISNGSDSIWLHIHDVGNAGRVDAVTQLPQRAYSPHEVEMIADSRSSNTLTETITLWTSGSITPIVNGVTGTAIPFTTNEDDSVALLAAELNSAFPQYISSATAALNVISITGQTGVTLSISFTITGPSVVTPAETFLPAFNLRAQAFALCSKLGMKFNFWSQNPLPASYSTASANLVATIRSDVVNPLTISQ